MEDLNKLSKAELIEKLNQRGNAGASTYDEEMQKVGRLSNISNPNQIPFTTTSDHKNIMLYTALNKRVGPLHPDNAERTMRRWKSAGIQLYTTPRSQQQIEAFKTTPEYKRSREKHDALRKQRRQQSAKGRNEQLIKDVASEAAKAVAGAKNG